MGTRLYPKTNDIAKLETLAYVPAGTHARLQAIKAQQEEETKGMNYFERNEIDYEYYCRIRDDEMLGRLDSFITFGYGRFSPPKSHPQFFEDVEKGYVLYSGETANMEEAEVLASVHGIAKEHAALSDGFCWG